MVESDSNNRIEMETVESGAEVDRFNDPDWVRKTLDDLDENLESVSAELKKSYVCLAAGVARIDKDIDIAFEVGDEMAYNAAKIKKSMILERLRELEALQL